MSSSSPSPSPSPSKPKADPSPQKPHQQLTKKPAPTPSPSAPSALEDDGPAPSTTEGGGAEAEGDEEEAAGEDKGVDYRLLVKMAGKKSASGGIVIPKRGEKDFEPLELGVNIQERALREGREAMFGALTGVRGGSSKSMSHAHFPYPSTSTSTSTSSPYPSSLPYVLLPRGNHFTTMGHTLRLPAPSSSTSLPYSSSPSDPSSSTTPSVVPKSDPVTVLLPEEALYLLERGSLYIWRGDMEPDAAAEAKLRDMGKAAPGSDVIEEVFSRNAVRMTVQEGWAAWGEELKGGRYTVYAQLKRQGYIVHRAPNHLPTFLQPTTLPPFPSSSSLASSSFPRTVAAVGLSLSRNIGGLFLGTFRSLAALGSWLWRSTFGRIGLGRGRGGLVDEEKANTNDVVDPWTPLIHRRRETPRTYSQIYSHLRIVSSPTSLPTPTPEEKQANPYEIYYHVWRPNGSYKKSKPSEPDFKVGVVDARLNPLATLPSFLSIFSSQPTLPIPAPRYPPRAPPPHARTNPRPPPPPPQQPSILYRFLVWLHVLPSPATKEEEEEEDKDKRMLGLTGNPFPMLKQGDKGFLLAVVDGGGVSWVRFGRGVFGRWGIQ